MQPIPGHVPSVHFGNAYFILPTVAANAVLYFLTGHLICQRRLSSGHFRRFRVGRFRRLKSCWPPRSGSVGRCRVGL
jgi:hypothetical protein